jgi:short-chain Z-isoprenyl diphosphate synthase
MLHLLYWLYEARLMRQIRTRPVPRHVGIILDGNRRYARKHKLADPRVAYDLGAGKLDDVLGWCFDLAIPAVTLWVCSIDNLKRPQTEVAGILAAVEAKIGGGANPDVGAVEEGCQRGFTGGSSASSHSELCLSN